METNETVLTRRVVGINDRKVLGKISGLRVDCDTLGVSHYLVNSSSTGGSLVLPFEKALSVGDTFLTVRGRGDFLPASREVQAIVDEGYQPVGVEAFSKTGNRLGTVASFEFDPVFGAVTSLALDTGDVFASDQFVFFAPEFVFVDDGEKTAEELRGISAPEKPVEAEREVEEGFEVEPEVEAEPEPESEAIVETEPEAVVEFQPEPEPEVEPEPESEVEPEPEGEAEPEPAEEDEEIQEGEAADLADDDPDADLIEFLLDTRLEEDVVSADGAFKALAGTVLTQQIIDEARAHDALLLLTMSVED